MFGTAGIRGIYGKDVTEELAMKVANIFAGKSLAIGRDIRKSGVSLLEAASKGVTNAGAERIDLGIVPTPTVALATKKHDCPGIMLTASHNPPEYNGLKLIEYAREISKEDERKIETAFKAGASRHSEKPGRLIHDSDIIEEHRALIRTRVDAANIMKKAPKVVLDCNGAGTTITPSLLRGLGCRVIEINSSLTEFSRPSEPNEKNLDQLAKLVVEERADIGIAHDGDADRCVMIDETGAMLPLDVQLAMMIDEELSKAPAGGSSRSGRKIVTTVEASLNIREVVERAGGEIEITPVGSSFVCDAMERTGAFFGGEPCGEYIYRDGVHVPDGILTAAKFVELSCQKGKLSTLRKTYKQHPIAREKFQAKDKYSSVKSIISFIKEESGIAGTVRDDDGVRVDEEDGWFLIRASGTEPIVRLTMEYKTEKHLAERKRQMEEVIKRNI